MAAVSSFRCPVHLISEPKGQWTLHQRICQGESFRNLSSLSGSSFKTHQSHATGKTRQFRVIAAKSSESEENVPSWAKPDSEEPPPWARNEGKPIDSDVGVEVPFYVYLLASAITAIAAVGSIFEYANQNPVFGVLSPDSIFYVPLLGFFAFTGIPTSAFLWYNSVQVANKEAEEQDKRDGYL